MDALQEVTSGCCIFWLFPGSTSLGPVAGKHDGLGGPVGFVFRTGIAGDGLCVDIDATCRPLLSSSPL